MEHVVGMVLLSFRVAVPAARNMQSPGKPRDDVILLQIDIDPCESGGLMFGALDGGTGKGSRRKGPGGGGGIEVEGWG